MNKIGILRKDGTCEKCEFSHRNKLTKRLVCDIIGDIIERGYYDDTTCPKYNKHFNKCRVGLDRMCNLEYCSCNSCDSLASSHFLVEVSNRDLVLSVIRDIIDFSMDNNMDIKISLRRNGFYTYFKWEEGISERFVRYEQVRKGNYDVIGFAVCMSFLED